MERETEFGETSTNRGRLAHGRKDVDVVASGGGRTEKEEEVRLDLSLRGRRERGKEGKGAVPS